MTTLFKPVVQLLKLDKHLINQSIFIYILFYIIFKKKKLVILYYIIYYSIYDISNICN